MSRATGKVETNEYYPTPSAVVDKLLSVVSFRDSDRFLEPCAGEGAIFNAVPLPDSQKSFAELSLGIDYLETRFDKQDVIITNPPFSLAEEFIRKSMSELADDGTMIYLQRVNFLGSLTRVNFWHEVGFPNKTPVIVPRPRFINGKSDSCEYCWFIWDRGGRVNLADGISHLVTGK